MFNGCSGLKSLDLKNFNTSNVTYMSDMFMDVHNMEAYVKYNYFHKEQRPRYTPNPFSPASLYYNKEQDFYVCPMGQHMKRIGMKRSITSNGFVTYSVRYQAERCDGCPLRGSCFKARGNRIIEVNHQL